MKKRQSQIEEIGIRELKSRASELVRSVKEKGARYVITRRGEPSAIVIPVGAALPGKYEDRAWKRLSEIGEELSKSWKGDKSAVEVLSENRR